MAKYAPAYMIHYGIELNETRNVYICIYQNIHTYMGLNWEADVVERVKILKCLVTGCMGVSINVKSLKC